MPFDGSGNFTRRQNWQNDAAAGIKIKADLHDNEDDNFASGLSLVLCRDGQGGPTDDISWNAFKITNLAPGVDPTDAVNVGQAKSMSVAIDANPGGIIISGSTPTSRLTYTGTTGPWGQSYTVADMSYGVAVISSINHWVWNDKADFSGTNLMQLSKAAIPALSLTSKDDTAGSGPRINLIRESPSPADNDSIGLLTFQGRNSAAVTVTYGQIFTQTTDVTSATEDATMLMQIRRAGTLSTALTLNAAGGILGGDLTVTSDIAFSGICGSNSNTGNVIKASHQCKNGVSIAGGAYSANMFNMLWTNNAMVLFVDNTSLGQIGISSDYRIKKDVQDLPSTWEQVKALHPVKYTQAEFTPVMSEETQAAHDEAAKEAPGPMFLADDSERWGFIAHETQAALVETAATGVKDMEDGVQGLNLAPILAATVKALQEAMLRIEALEVQLLA